jgi:hypothetical protein
LACIAIGFLAVLQPQDILLLLLCKVAMTGADVTRWAALCCLVLLLLLR